MGDFGVGVLILILKSVMTVMPGKKIFIFSNVTDGSQIQQDLSNQRDSSKPQNTQINIITTDN